MASLAGRRRRPLALVCALLMVAWGAASIASLVVQFTNYNDFGWPDQDADGQVWAYVVLYLAAAGAGAWVAVWGLFGLAWRPPLHLGVLSLLVAVAVEVTANIVQVNYFSDLGASVSLSDQAEWYVDRVTFDTGGTVGSEGRAFATALPLMTAVLPLLTWLVVLFSGAGRKGRPAPAYGRPVHPQQQYAQPQQPHQQPHQQPQQQPQQQPPPPTPPPYVLPPEPYVAPPAPDPPTLRYPTVPPERPVRADPPPPPDRPTTPYPAPPKDS